MSAILVETYDAIEKWQAERGYTPSVRELCIELGLSSTSSVHRRLKSLVAQGAIERRGPRALVLKGME